MKKICKWQVLILLLVVALSGCSRREANTAVANPWVASDLAGVLEATGFEINVPKDAFDVKYSYESTGKMAQATYVLDDKDWVYRIKETPELEDISGMYYDWTVSEEGTVSQRPAVFMGYSDSKSTDSVDGVWVVNWYDVVTGVSYSLSVTGADLNGMDIQVYAEEIFAPLQTEVTDDPQGDLEEELNSYFLGEHIRSEDESSLTIEQKDDGTFDVDISILKLCSLEDGEGTFDNHVMNFVVKDPNGNDMYGRIYRDSDNSLIIEITDSTWNYLPNGEILAGFGK